MVFSFRSCNVFSSISSQSLPEFLKQGPTSQCMISLCNRPVDISNGTLLVSLSSGRVQVWSHHEAVQRYITDFNAIHVAGDVSKWLIDVHFCIVILIYSFSLSLTHSRPLQFFGLNNIKKNKTILFSTMPLFSFFSLLLFRVPPTPST